MSERFASDSSVAALGRSLDHKDEKGAQAGIPPLEESRPTYWPCKIQIDADRSASSRGRQPRLIAGRRREGAGDAAERSATSDGAISASSNRRKKVNLCNRQGATMDFSLSSSLQELQARTRRFIAEEVIPYERTRARPRTARASNCARSWSGKRVLPAC